MNEQDLIQRGIQAKELLDNQLLQKSLTACREEILNRWEITPGNQVEEREWLWKVYHASKVFEQLLLGVIDTGRIAQEKLKNVEKQSLKQKIRSIM